MKLGIKDVLKQAITILDKESIWVSIVIGLLALTSAIDLVEEVVTPNSLLGGIAVTLIAMYLFVISNYMVNRVINYSAIVVVKATQRKFIDLFLLKVDTYTDVDGVVSIPQYAMAELIEHAKKMNKHDDHLNEVSGGTHEAQD